MGVPSKVRFGSAWSHLRQFDQSSSRRVEGALHLPSTYDIPPLWREKKRLWDSSGNFEPQSIRSSGEWNWDFSFLIPTHFDNTTNGGSPQSRLPGNFSLRPYTGFMQYRVLLFVKRGKYLSDLVELQTLFSYISRERAPPPSPLREVAYYQGSTPPGPEADPDGWKPCDTINAKGVIFGNREVNLVYRPFLANPVSLQLHTSSSKRCQMVANRQYIRAVAPFFIALRFQEETLRL
ncbi:unnamed protein product [Rhizoctonia solani]|uniref:Uncharacterized protein n=1 Tax=Rhizoctonia solani TaxID=456999 RepID=A0A8H3HWM8_9AGAM|nr:unnamed protein product [Rhizoctonia solani]